MIKRVLLSLHYGCKVNQYETNAMMQQMIENGYEIVNFEEIANVYIINTCTVTNMADKKSRQMLHRVKEINPNSILVVVGCYAQVAKQELEKIEDIDIILGTNEKKNIIQYIQAFEKEQNKEAQVSDISNKQEFTDFGMVTYTEKTRAVIKIQDGCNQFCSYCIIPYARGRIRSRKPENVINEIKQIAKQGIKEVVLTGIHIASYGKDFNKQYELIDLLEEIEKIEEIQRVRLGSLEPTLITEEFVKRLSKLSKICDHFHLSLQSGCDETLKRMNRKYTTKEFAKAVNLLKTMYPKVALTTDIIVGFPGETQQEFETTYQFLRQMNFYKMHVFPYSPREGTVAAKMADQIVKKIKEDRSKILIELSNQNEKQQNEAEIGQTVKVLLEEKQGEYWKGHTTNYKMIKVKLESEKDYHNTIVEVKVASGDIG